MRRLALTSLFLSALSPLAQTVLDPTALYVSDPLRWERGKRPGEPAPELAFAEILVLEPSGDLAILSCYLNRSPDNRLDILYQSGFSLCSGTWEKADGHLVARFRSVHTSERKVGETEAVPSEKNRGAMPLLAMGFGWRNGSRSAVRDTFHFGTSMTSSDWLRSYSSTVRKPRLNSNW